VKLKTNEISKNHTFTSNFSYWRFSTILNDFWSLFLISDYFQALLLYLPRGSNFQKPSDSWVFVKHAMTHDDPRWPPNQQLIPVVDRASWVNSMKIHDDPNGCQVEEIFNKHRFFQPTMSHDDPYFLPVSRPSWVRYIPKISAFYNVV